jgi:Rab-3A-interacting protein
MASNGSLSNGCKSTDYEEENNNSNILMVKRPISGEGCPGRDDSCIDDLKESDSGQSTQCMAGCTEAALKEELRQANQALKQKTEECQQLKADLNKAGVEMVELSASLFEEANKMINDANIKKIAAEKLYKEAAAKIDVLDAEVTALKAVVMTSTPSMPNPHLNPQIDKNKTKVFSKGHSRSSSHQLQQIVVQPPRLMRQMSSAAEFRPPVVVDQNFMDMFRQWRLNPSLESSSPFLELLKLDDIVPCLHFNDDKASLRLYEGIIANTLNIEPLMANDETVPQRRCSLSDASVVCKYLIRLGDALPFFAVSQAARNRVSAVCDLITYIRYIAQGLVKSSERDMYAEITRLRRMMCLARLGLDE